MGGFQRVVWAAQVVQGHTGLGRRLGDVLCSLPWSPAHAYRAFVLIGKETRVTDVYTVDSAVETMTPPGLNHFYTSREVARGVGSASERVTDMSKFQ